MTIVAAVAGALLYYYCTVLICVLKLLTTFCASVILIQFDSSLKHYSANILLKLKCPDSRSQLPLICENAQTLASHCHKCNLLNKHPTPAVSPGRSP